MVKGKIWGEMHLSHSLPFDENGSDEGNRSWWSSSREKRERERESDWQTHRFLSWEWPSCSLSLFSSSAFLFTLSLSCYTFCVVFPRWLSLPHSLHFSCTHPSFCRHPHLLLLFSCFDQSNASEVNSLSSLSLSLDILLLQLKPDGSCVISRVLTEANTSNIFTNLRSWYPVNTTCLYRFSVPEAGDRISLHFLWFRIERVSFCGESLRIFDSSDPDLDKLMNKVCDTNKPIVSIIHSINFLPEQNCLPRREKEWGTDGQSSNYDFCPFTSDSFRGMKFLPVTHPTDQFQYQVDYQFVYFLSPLPVFPEMIGRFIQIDLYVNWTCSSDSIFLFHWISIWILH